MNTGFIDDNMVCNRVNSLRKDGFVLHCNVFKKFRVVLRIIHRGDRGTLLGIDLAVIIMLASGSI